MPKPNLTDKEYLAVRAAQHELIEEITGIGLCIAVFALVWLPFIILPIYASLIVATGVLK